jgi:RNA ligase (TIGR02306 family)
MRKLVTIRRIKEIKPIEGADRIELAIIDGWQVVTKKDEFKVDDLCVYFEIDSILPRQPWNDFLADKNDPEKPIRLRTVKLRGAISQGLAIPIKTVLGNVEKYWETPKVGDDVTELLGVTKYEPPIPASLGGEVAGKIPYKVTDEERIQNIPEIIDEFAGREVYVTQKIDGTSTTFGIKDGVFVVAGRNWAYKEGVSNTYAKMAEKYDIESRLRKVCEETGYEWAIQGETYGEGIQKNRLGIKGQDFAIFNVLRNGLKIEWIEETKENEVARKFLFDIPTVYVLYKGVFKWKSVQELLDYADSFKYPNGHQAEGIVIRPVEYFLSEVLATTKPSFKVISNKFLSKNKDA